MLIVLSPSSGLFGNIARMFGVIDPPNLMGQAGAFKSIYVWSDVWQHAGWDSIIYIAALAAVDPPPLRGRHGGRRRKMAEN